MVARELAQNGRPARLMRMEVLVKRPLYVFLVRGSDNDGRERVVRGVAVYHAVRLALVLVHGLVLGGVELVGEERRLACCTPAQRRKPTVQ